MRSTWIDTPPDAAVPVSGRTLGAEARVLGVTAYVVPARRSAYPPPTVNGVHARSMGCTALTVHVPQAHLGYMQVGRRSASPKVGGEFESGDGGGRSRHFQEESAVPLDGSQDAEQALPILLAQLLVCEVGGLDEASKD